MQARRQTTTSSGLRGFGRVERDSVAPPGVAFVELTPISPEAAPTSDEMERMLQLTDLEEARREACLFREATAGCLTPWPADVAAEALTLCGPGPSFYLELELP